MVAPTPKFKSREFKEALGSLKEIFDAHSLSIVLVDALERQPAEQIFARMGRHSGGARLANMKKTEIIGQLTNGFFASEEIAFQLMKDMDRACQKERHIVASIPEEQAPDRIGSYRAIALKRERAKFVWALARDERAAVRQLANRIIKEFFEEAADFEVAKAVLEGNEDQSALKDIELAKRLKEQAERLAEAAQKVTDLESKVLGFEEERARLLAAMGQKERSLKSESAARGELEQQLAELKTSLSHVESEHREAEEAKQNELEARAALGDLAQKVRRLSKLAGVSATLQTKEEELEQATRAIDDLERQLIKEKEEHELERDAWAKEQAKQRAELEELREELRSARKQLASIEHAPARAVEGERRRGVSILLDQANLAATASMSFHRKVNFSALIDRLAQGRPVVRAIAFVVDNGGANFDAFCDTLKKSGWELRIKKPKTFADGTTKADWDMGIAMEAIALRDEAETLVLASGDGDFVPLVKQLHRWGVTVEIAAYPDGLSLELVNAADRVARLDQTTLE
jgi:uncharacterized LabA/DUF88 family protein